jgi:hypothetical protein
VNWVEFTQKVGIPEVDSGKTYRSGGLVVIVTVDGPDKRWHLSISHRGRYPTWDEIKQARYDLIPNHVTMAQLLPPKEEYVNLHPNTFHLHEVRMHE